jgi:hypothetical protein
MFRRLAEAYQDIGSDNHTNYVTNQNVYFNSLPNIIPSGTSGLKGFDVAIQSVDANGNAYQQTPMKYPNSIFRKDTSSNLDTLAKQCSESSIDALISIKNPNAPIGCGWLYTPPPKGSPYPNVSQGFIGDANGPLQTYSPSEHKKWFFDLQLAKKQMLMDKCKALKACSDVDSDIYKGICGYCTDTNQGVPLNTVGQPLYGNDKIGSCTSQSIVTSSINCPIPSSSGPQAITDRTCTPNNEGRLSADCLYSKLLTAGCSDNGTLAIALSNPSSPDDYIANIRNADSVKIYNRVAKPPLNLDIFSKGSTTVDIVLKEARQLASNARQPVNTQLGASARDLCLQTGSIKSFDFCSDMPDTTASPFDINCLQILFKKMGGLPNGTSYPSNTNIQTYNNMGTLGAVKQYLNQLTESTKSSDYKTQRTAMIQLLGITPDKMIKRAPYNQGIEVFWLIPVPGSPNKVSGLLRRTIEKDFIQFGENGYSSTGAIPQIGIIEYSAMLQMTDVRVKSDFSTKFQVLVDDGFWIAINQPPNIDTQMFNDLYADVTGLFGNLSIQGLSTYQSKVCSNFMSSFPNIMKMYYDDAGGGGHTFVYKPQLCSGTSYLSSPYYSLTCEPRAPFLTYEVNDKEGMFQELRNPGIFSQFLGMSGLEYHIRTEERKSVPGNKPFVRINSANSVINMPNIAFQSWGTFTTAIRLQTMPVKETILNFISAGYYCNIIATPTSGSITQLSIETNINTSIQRQIVSTTFTLALNKWYLLYVANNGSGLDIYCSGIDDLIQNKGISTAVSLKASGSIYLTNATWNAPPSQIKSGCNIMIGTSKYMSLNGMYSTSSFNYDIAWIHFFDHYTNGDDIYRDCMSNWIYTQFPDTPNTYSTLQQ